MGRKRVRKARVKKLWKQKNGRRKTKGGGEGEK